LLGWLHVRKEKKQIFWPAHTLVFIGRFVGKDFDFLPTPCGLLQFGELNFGELESITLYGLLSRCRLLRLGTYGRAILNKKLLLSCCEWECDYWWTCGGGADGRKGTDARR